MAVECLEMVAAGALLPVSAPCRRAPPLQETSQALIALM